MIASLELVTGGMYCFCDRLIRDSRPGIETSDDSFGSLNAALLFMYFFAILVGGSVHLIRFVVHMTLALGLEVKMSIYDVPLFGLRGARYQCFLPQV